MEDKHDPKQPIGGASRPTGAMSAEERMATAIKEKKPDRPKRPSEGSKRR
jgi:hypothetical protein